MEEPNKILLRPRDIKNWTGISLEEFHKMVRCGLIPFKIIKPNGNRWFLKEDIKRILLEGYK